MLTISRVLLMGKPGFSLFACMGILVGCSTTGPHYTKADFKVANGFCYRQAYDDQAAKVPNWFSRWLACSKERVMPIEIYAFQGNENEVRHIYEKMSEVAPDVDSGKLSVRSFYAQMDQMKEDLLNIRCFVKLERPDGGNLCLSYQRARK